MFPRYNELATSSEPLALNLIIYVPLTKNNDLPHCNASLNNISY